MKMVVPFIALFAVFSLFHAGPAAGAEPVKIRLAVEFLDHAAAAHIARNQKWYEEEGLSVEAFSSYATGTALSAALAKGDIDAAYICLFPAINAYANAHVPLVIVAGTHLYGYGLIVNPEKIKTVRDLTAPGIRVGCTSDGSPPAALLYKLMETYSLDETLVTQARRMPPAKLLFSLQAGQIDAAFLPEQFPSMGEAAGFKELVSAKDLWPGMQGSVLIVTRTFLNEHPDAVKVLVSLTARGIAFIREKPREAAKIVAEELTVAGEEITATDPAGTMGKLVITPETVEASLTGKLEHTLQVDPRAVQDAIDFAARIGYIKASFPAEEMLEIKFFHE